jgi:hypothetical protein
MVNNEYMRYGLAKDNIIGGSVKIIIQIEGSNHDININTTDNNTAFSEGFTQAILQIREYIETNGLPLTINDNGHIAFAFPQFSGGEGEEVREDSGEQREEDLAECVHLSGPDGCAGRDYRYVGPVASEQGSDTKPQEDSRSSDFHWVSV